MQDEYYGANIGISDPSNEAYAVVPHAADPLPNGVPRFIYVGTPGTLVCKLPDSAGDVSYLNASGFMPIRPSHVRASSSAAGIIAHY